jgi:hypothetical protein
MALLEKLLARQFPGRDALRLQPSSVSGTQIDEDSSLELRYEGNNLAETSCTEGTCVDIDGGVIAVLLHVKNGRMRLLEIFKEDGLRILRPRRRLKIWLRIEHSLKFVKISPVAQTRTPRSSSLCRKSPRSSISIVFIPSLRAHSRFKARSSIKQHSAGGFCVISKARR